VKPETLADGLAGAPRAEGARTLARLAGDALMLVKPRIGAFVVLAAFTGGLLAAGPDASPWRVLAAALAIGLVGASSSVFNQVLERHADARMLRTRARPLPAGRVSVRDATLFGALLGIAGTTVLAAAFTPLSALLALSTLVAYVLVYTPLKQHTSFNTVVGAVPGAMPPLLGALALGGAPGAWGWMLYATVFLWQFPHFLAIAWLHREDYRRAGMQMLPALPDSAGMAGRQAFLHALVLLPVGLLPGVRGDAGITYTAIALLVGAAYAAAALAFACRESERSARAVLLVSLIHLPLLLTGALLDPVVSLVLRSSSS
jgi:protoheme IX farnesyltransferase